jgi:hypothetical protein
MASLLSPMRPSNELAKPFRKQAPEPPQQADQNPEADERILKLRHLEERYEASEGEIDERDPEDDLREKLQDLPPEGN